MYSQEISRLHHVAVVIAIDQSSSMSGRMSTKDKIISKADAVSMVTGKLIDELIMRSHRDNGYRYYYDIAILGYSGDRVYSLLGDKIEFVPITTLANRNVRRTQYCLNCATLERESTPLDEMVSMWVEPHAEGATPMYKMIKTATNLVAEWCDKEENRESFPPLVFNITDGEASDADYEMLRKAAQRLKMTGTEDGNTLFMNIHISSDTNHAQLIFPSPNEVPISVLHAHLLMDMSSLIPEQMYPYIALCRSNFVKPPYLAMSYNASMSELIAALNIGSRSLIMGL